MTDAETETEPALSQSAVVIRGIKDMIVSGRLGPGDRLPIEKDLATGLGVSRGSLREGVRALVILGVLDTRQGDGTYVTSLDPTVLLSPMGMLSELHTETDSAHLLAVRRFLEAESVALAALNVTDQQLSELSLILDGVEDILRDDPDMDLERFIDADTKFHRVIAHASGNPPLAALIEGLVSRTFRARLWRAITERGTVRETQHEHRAILAELARRDPSRARIRMETHLLGVEQFAVEHGQEAPDSVSNPASARPDHSDSGISAE